MKSLSEGLEVQQKEKLIPRTNNNE